MLIIRDGERKTHAVAVGAKGTVAPVLAPVFFFHRADTCSPRGEDLLGGATHLPTSHLI